MERNLIQQRTQNFLSSKTFNLNNSNNNNNNNSVNQNSSQDFQVNLVLDLDQPSLEVHLDPQLQRTHSRIHSLLDLVGFRLHRIQLRDCLEQSIIIKHLLEEN